MKWWLSGTINVGDSKMFTITLKYFSFLKIWHLQAESSIKQRIFLHVIPD